MAPTLFIYATDHFTMPKGAGLEIPGLDQLHVDEVCIPPCHGIPSPLSPDGNLHDGCTYRPHGMCSNPRARSKDGLKSALTDLSKVSFTIHLK